jgi:actin cytoskeleton-regulatory complex protein SLA1
MGGSSPSNLHFQAGSKDNAEAILEKLLSSKALSNPEASSSPRESLSTESSRLPPIRTDAGDHDKPRKNGASVHFSASSPVIIPARDASEEELEATVDEEESPPEIGGEETVDGSFAIALYDFTADGEDELSVKKDERLYVLERDGEEWWKCQNAEGAEGVVPASYLEVSKCNLSLGRNFGSMFRFSAYRGRFGT